MNEAWLSEEAWRSGISKLGVPARLNGLEKLNDGRGRPEASEQTEGDRWYGGKAGDIIPVLLVLDSFRTGCEWKDALSVAEPSSSVPTSGEDRMLEDLFGNSVRGGASPEASNGSIRTTFSGELVCTKLCTGDWCEWFELLE